MLPRPHRGSESGWKPCWPVAKAIAQRTVGMYGSAAVPTAGRTVFGNQKQAARGIPLFGTIIRMIRGEPKIAKKNAHKKWPL
jgi:hypothetical protein